MEAPEPTLVEHRRDPTYLSEILYWCFILGGAVVGVWIDSPSFELIALIAPLITWLLLSFMFGTLGFYLAGLLIRDRRGFGAVGGCLVAVILTVWHGPSTQPPDTPATTYDQRAAEAELAALQEEAKSAVEQMNVSLETTRVRELAKGMIVGRARDDDIYDIVFPGDMLPDEEVIAMHGKSAQLVFSIRIAEDTPIMVIKLVHYTQGDPLGVTQVTATSGTDTVVHSFSPQMVTRQSVSGGIIEFATCVPFVEESAEQLLSVIQNASACKIEVKGTRGYTTFSPGKTSRDHARRMVALFDVLKSRPSLIANIQRNALSFAEFQEALVGAP